MLKQILFLFCFLGFAQQCDAKSIISPTMEFIQQDVESDIKTPQPEKCESPFLLDAKNSNALFALLKNVKKTPKTEWIIFDEYFKENKFLYERIINNSIYKCNKFLLKMPLDWKFDAEKSEIDFGVKYLETINLSDLKSSSTMQYFSAANFRHNYLKIEGAKDLHEVEFSYVWSIHNVRKIIKTPLEINKCIKDAYKYSEFSAEPLSLSVSRCHNISYNHHVAFFESDSSKDRLFSNNFPLSIDEAKIIRQNGLFLFVEFEIAFDFIEVGKESSQIHSILHDAYIGKSPEDKLFCPTLVGKDYLEKRALVKSVNACLSIP